MQEEGVDHCKKARNQKCTEDKFEGEDGPSKHRPSHAPRPNPDRLDVAVAVHKQIRYRVHISSCMPRKK